MYMYIHIYIYTYIYIEIIVNACARAASAAGLPRACTEGPMRFQIGLSGGCQGGPRQVPGDPRRFIGGGVSGLRGFVHLE